MVRTILWDFDGVILDSVKIKGDGFIELFKEYDKESLKQMEEFHYAYGGVSRFEKIKFFFEKIIRKDINANEVNKLACRFAEIIEHRIGDKNNLIEEAVSYIKENHQKYNFHIVSGAEHIEINKLCDNFGLTKYFISIDGSPTKKDILVKKVIEKYKYKKEETILIGDAMTDYESASINNIVFYGYNNIKLKDYNYLNSLTELRAHGV
jgi:phosphoglycolate phosphatase-like HAD superfamily hydrolase